MLSSKVDFSILIYILESRLQNVLDAWLPIWCNGMILYKTFFSKIEIHLLAFTISAWKFHALWTLTCCSLFVFLISEYFKRIICWGKTHSFVNLRRRIFKNCLKMQYLQSKFMPQFWDRISKKKVHSGLLESAVCRTFVI